MKHITLLALMFGSFWVSQNPTVSVSVKEDFKGVTFKEYLRQFEEASLPFTLDVEDLTPKVDPYEFPLYEQMENNPEDYKEISTAYEKFFPHISRSRFSRMGPNSYFFEKKLATTDEFILVMYSEARPMSIQKQNYILITYSRNGKIIDELHFANSRGFADITTATINEKFEIVKTDGILKWEKDPYDVPLSANTLKSVKLIESTSHKIARNGKFISTGSLKRPIEIKKVIPDLDQV